MGEREGAEKQRQPSSASGAAAMPRRRDAAEQRADAPQAEERSGRGCAPERVRRRGDADVGRAKRRADPEQVKTSVRIAGERSEPPRGRRTSGSGRQRRDAGWAAKASVPASITRPLSTSAAPACHPTTERDQPLARRSSAAASCERDLISSLRKLLVRCTSTVL